MDYFQDLIQGNHCFGCGPHNPAGLQIKSTWSGEKESVCVFQPSAHHCAAPTKFLNGGIIATIIDCHSVCTAIAYAYRRAGRSIGQGEPVWYATGHMAVDFKRPVPIHGPVTLKAGVQSESEKRITLECRLVSDDKVCVKSRVVAVQVPGAWME